MTWLALTREVSPSLADCELTHLERVTIDVARARVQHAAYEEALRAMGCRVVRVTPAPENPDAVFIEDTAVVIDEIAVITRPGAESRRTEVDAVADALVPLRRLVRIEAPGTLDGGDVLLAGKQCFVGRTTRSNADGIAQLRAHLAPFGYTVTGVDVHGCLHLKSAATALDDETLLANPAWVDIAQFGALRVVSVDSAEPMAANVVRIGARLLAADGYPSTVAGLRAAGYDVTTVPADELAKAEGAVTCCSLILREPIPASVPM